MKTLFHAGFIMVLILQSIEKIPSKFLEVCGEKIRPAYADRSYEGEGSPLQVATGRLELPTRGL